MSLSLTKIFHNITDISANNARNHGCKAQGGMQM